MFFKLISLLNIDLNEFNYFRNTLCIYEVENYEKTYDVMHATTQSINVYLFYRNLNLIFME